MTSSKQALFLLVVAATLACASAQEVHVFRETDLAALVDHSIPARAELVGRFIYLGTAPLGFEAFSSFKESSGDITFGNILIAVKFLNGAPRNLSVGKVILPDEKNPLVIEAVKRTPDGAFILVRATYVNRI
jgi:hypothetical protein